MKTSQQLDWVQDAAQEQLRRRKRRKETATFFNKEGVLGWRRKVWESYDAATAWIVVTLVGIVIGFVAAALNIITEWLSDIKMGLLLYRLVPERRFLLLGLRSGM